MGFKKYWGGKMYKMDVRQENEWVKCNFHALLAVVTKTEQKRSLSVGSDDGGSDSHQWLTGMGYFSAGCFGFSTCFFQHHSGYCTMATTFQMTLRLKWLNKHAQVEPGKWWGSSMEFLRDFSDYMFEDSEHMKHRGGVWIGQKKTGIVYTSL